MRGLKGMIAGLGATLSLGAPALAQIPAPDAWAAAPQDSPTVRLNRQSAFNMAADRAFGPALEFETDVWPVDAASPFVAATRRDVWIEGEGFTDRLSLTTAGALRRADGAPLPPGPQDAGIAADPRYDFRYVRGWPAASGYTASGLEVSLTPYAGVGMGSDGGSAEAGATLRIGQGLDRMMPEGQAAFGERARWYVYAAGSGRAVGYNFARTRDGDFARSGYSHDSGAFMGDASVGVALRRGAVQGSLGLVYREIKAEGLRGGRDFDRDVSEGLVAFQLSIKPD